MSFEQNCTILWDCGVKNDEEHNINKCNCAGGNSGIYNCKLILKCPNCDKINSSRENYCGFPNAKLKKEIMSTYCDVSPFYCEECCTKDCHSGYFECELCDEIVGVSCKNICTTISPIKDVCINCFNKNIKSKHCNRTHNKKCKKTVSYNNLQVDDINDIDCSYTMNTSNVDASVYAYE